jgi:hypothetical protein
MSGDQRLSDYLDHIQQAAADAFTVLKKAINFRR